MDKELKERIKYLLHEKNFTILQLGGGIENQRCKLSRQLNNNDAEVTMSTIKLIAKTFPDVSLEWLIRGEGTMDKSGHFAPNIYATNGSIVQGGNNKGDATISNPSQFELYGKDVVIASKDAEIATLHNTVVKLEADKEKLYLLLQAFTKCSR